MAKREDERHVDREQAHPTELIDTVLPRPCPCGATPKHDTEFTGEERHDDPFVVGAPSERNGVRFRIYRCSHGALTEFEILWAGRPEPESSGAE